MKRLLKGFLVTCMTVFLIGVVALAETASLKVAYGSTSAVQTAQNDASAAVGGANIVSVSGDIISFDNGAYTNLSVDKRKLYMEVFLKSIKSNGSLGAKERNSIYNFIASQDTEITQALKYITEDTSADLVRARKWLAPFTGGISTFTGLLSILVFLFLGVGLLMDVAYLALPGLQLLLERGDPKKKPFGVSVEAWRVNREVASDYKNSKNEITEYLKKRVPIILVCAICIGYLVSGQIYDALAYFANAFSSL